jgi:hypothetical protein
MYFSLIEEEQGGRESVILGFDKSFHTATAVSNDNDVMIKNPTSLSSPSKPKLNTYSSHIIIEQRITWAVIAIGIWSVSCSGGKIYTVERIPQACIYVS